MWNPRNHTFVQFENPTFVEIEMPSNADISNYSFLEFENHIWWLTFIILVDVILMVWRVSLLNFFINLW